MGAKIFPLAQQQYRARDQRVAPEAFMWNGGTSALVFCRFALGFGHGVAGAVGGQKTRNSLIA
jgi:hypothetical protein